MPGDDPPLIAGRVHGIRSWELVWRDGDAHLGGFANARWAVGGEPTVARCRSRAGHGRREPVPGPTCGCGLYGLHPWPTALDHTYLGVAARNAATLQEPTDQVVGIVEAWGRVELHGDGFRAEFARPIALALIGAPRESDAGHARRRLAARYRAEVIEVAGGRELIEHCRERGLGLSRTVVASLLPREADDDAVTATARPTRPRSRSHPAPTPPRRPPPSRLARVGEHILTAVAAVLAVAWYGFWAAVAVMFVIGVVSGDFGSAEPSFSERNLRVERQALVRIGGDVRYVAVVRNTSERRAAVAAFARGRVARADGERLLRLGTRNRIETRPTLLPGEAGVVVDVLPGLERKRLPRRLRYETEFLARREPAAPGARPPVALGRPALDRARCSLRVPVEARHPGLRTGMTLVAIDDGRIGGAGTIGVGRRAVRSGARSLRLGEPGECPGWIEGVEAYPFLTPSQARRAGGDGA